MEERKYGAANGAILGHAGEIHVSREGLWTGSCRYRVPKGRYDLMPKIGSVHPYAEFLFVEKLRVIYTEGLWTVLCEYAGASFTSSGVTDATYELSPGTGSEPIEIHPEFDEFAGTPSAPNEDNKPLFRDPVTGFPSTDDEVAEFDRFQSGSPLYGVKSYICQNNTVWTKRWTQKNKPEDEPLKVVSSPPGPAPEYGGAYNWLQYPVAYSVRGNVYSCSQNWLSSGPKGWSTVIY
jgi:hypothetical protein